MLKEAIEKIEELCKPFLFPPMEDGRIYASREIFEVHDPSPAPLEIRTLTGLADYLKANVDGLAPEELMLQVVDPEKVHLFSRVQEPWADRCSIIVVKNDSLKFPFGQWMDVENFIIKMQSLFVQDENTAAILKVVGNVSESAVRSFSDDGVSQQVMAKAGVSRVADVVVPNPVMLAPFRTFLEIEQPASRFVFRMKSGTEMPTCALFEADGGAWRSEAMKGIKVWLGWNTEKIAIIA